MPETIEGVAVQIKDLFEQHRNTTFESGMKSVFSLEWCSIIHHYRHNALEALWTLYETPLPVYVLAEALFWVGHHDGLPDYKKYSFLIRYLSNGDVIIRDSALMAICHLDKEYLLNAGCLPLLGNALKDEKNDYQVPHIQQVIDWLEE